MQKRTTARLLLSAIFLAVCFTPAFSQTERSGSVDEVGALKEQVALQQKQIEQLRVALAEQKQLLERVIQATQAQPARDGAQPAHLGEVASLAPVVPAATAGGITPKVIVRPEDFPSRGGAVTASTSSGASSQYPAEKAGGAESKRTSPLSLHIGDADFTVGGFMDFTAIFRSTNVGSGIGTSFGAIPYSNTPQGRLSETRFTAQNSRLSLTTTSKVGASNVKGYVEADFLGFQPTNGFVTSNSNSLRMRLYWLQLTRGKFEILAGQSWSMLNPNRVGLSPAPADVFFSQDMDTNYQVGLTWARQAQVRFIYHPTKEWAAGVSLENPQQLVGNAVLLPSTFPSVEVDQGGNVGTPNLHPDIIPKVAYDGKVGNRAVHVEVAGLLSSFKVFNPPPINSSFTATGGGGSLNANLELVKDLHLILNTFHSDGGGRYIFGLGPDLIVRPDGTSSLVHASSGIAGFEWQANPKSMFYSYYGGAYFRRNTAIDPVTKNFLGFGFPGSSTAHNRSVQEATFGLIQTFCKNPNYGALQLITQYSYLTRAPWSVATGTPKNAHASMGYVDLRYVLP